MSDLLTIAHLPFMLPNEEQHHITEGYVSSPPALVITDAGNNVFALGFMEQPKGRGPDGEFAFDVLRNGKATGEIASRIEMRKGVVRIFTRNGWKRFSGTSFI